MRSVLTALGIIIGVGAVIAMVGIGNGAKAQVEAQIASLGENVILIFSGSTTSSGIRTGWGGAGTLEDRRRRSDSARSARRDRRKRGSCLDQRRSLPETKTGSPAFTGSRRITLTFDSGHWPMARRSRRRMCAARTKFASLAERQPRRFTATKIPSARFCGSKMCRSRSSACSRPRA